MTRPAWNEYFMKITEDVAAAGHLRQAQGRRDQRDWTTISSRPDITERPKGFSRCTRKELPPQENRTSPFGAEARALPRPGHAEQERDRVQAGAYGR